MPTPGPSPCLLQMPLRLETRRVLIPTSLPPRPHPSTQTQRAEVARCEVAPTPLAALAPAPRPQVAGLRRTRAPPNSRRSTNRPTLCLQHPWRPTQVAATTIPTTSSRRLPTRSMMWSISPMPVQAETTSTRLAPHEGLRYVCKYSPDCTAHDRSYARARTRILIL